MNTRLYVGNLSFNTTADGVRTAFQQFGNVSDVHLVTDRETGQSRGFAFVEMSDADAAQSAIAQLNGAQLHGRSMNVNEARPKPAGSGGGGGGARRGGFGGRDSGRGSRGGSRW